MRRPVKETVFIEYPLILRGVKLGIAFGIVIHRYFPSASASILYLNNKPKNTIRQEVMAPFVGRCVILVLIVIEKAL